MVQIVNLTDVAQQVGIFLADGKRATVRVMPKRKVDLAKGQTVDQNWVALNPHSVRVRGMPQTVLVKKGTDAKAPTSTAKKEGE